MSARRVAALLACAPFLGALPAAEHAAEHRHDSVAGEAGPIAGLYSAADLQFLTHMIVHHEQALELCALVAARTDREEFLRFSRYLNDAQQAEIDHMKGLLEQARARGATIPETHLHGDPPMAGMLSRAQMNAITAARGREFERLWLTGMILHHEGAVDMALAQQEAQFRNRNQPWGVDTLVDDVLSVQRGEIGKMRDWLATWR